MRRGDISERPDRTARGTGEPRPILNNAGQFTASPQLRLILGQVAPRLDVKFKLDNRAHPDRRTKLREYEWRITRIKGTPAAFVGRVAAPDAETAIKRAIVEFEITNREHQKRLVAQRVG